MKKPDKCIHFNGIGSGTCEAGVKYDDVKDTSTSPFSFPCLVKYNRSGCKCEKFQLPTPEQVAADEAEMKKHFDDTMKARAAIVDSLGGPWKKGTPGSSGRIDCPVCGQKDTLRFSRSAYNGHIAADCLTQNCVSWME